jgi:alpha-L-fucosidase
MNKSIIVLCFIVISFLACISCKTALKDKYYEYTVTIEPEEDSLGIINKAAFVVPTSRQSSWQDLEFTCFIHFTVNTFTGREWGDGKEDPAIFNPTDLNVNQWVNVAKDAGMKLIILTCKHHDGFCLWPSKTTEHSIKNSPYKNGKGDIVKELSEACRQAGLKFGVYLSPWDRNCADYGNSPVYNEFFRNQLRELLSNYGEISEVWFDGACGEGINGNKQVYDWNSYYKIIREFQPNAVISTMGPDVRWVGNEGGLGRETEWAVLPLKAGNLDVITNNSQKDEKEPVFEPKDRIGGDLGSREIIIGAKSLVWYPSEVDVSIRPGWFYHENQDSLVKSPEELVNIYYQSVGRNSVLLLNIPPDKRGRIHEKDVAALQGMRQILDDTFKENFLSGAKISENDGGNNSATNSIDNNKETYFITQEGVFTSTLNMELDQSISVNVLMLQEYIKKGQRIERFILEYLEGGQWKEACKGTTIGYKRLIRFPEIASSKFRLQILQSRDCPMISEIGLFREKRDY